MNQLNRNIDGSLPTLPYLDDDERIKVDLPCVICGYNLRTVHIQGSCPECGAPASNAFLTPAHLADHTWLKRVRLGAFGILFAVFLRFGMCCVPDFRLDSEPAEALVLFLLALPMITACWLFSMEEPGAKDRYLHATSRISLRIASVLEVFAVACVPLAGALSGPSTVAGAAVMLWALLHFTVVAFIARLVVARMQRFHSRWEKYFVTPAVVLYGCGLVVLAFGATVDAPFGVLMCGLSLPAVGGIVLLTRMVELASKLYPLETPDEYQ